MMLNVTDNLHTIIASYECITIFVLQLKAKFKSEVEIYDFTCPFTYSSVCSRAIFMYPSKHANTPGKHLIERTVELFAAKRTLSNSYLCNRRQS